MSEEPALIADKIKDGVLNGEQEIKMSGKVPANLPFADECERVDVRYSADQIAPRLAAIGCFIKVPHKAQELLDQIESSQGASAALLFKVVEIFSGLRLRGLIFP